MTEGDDLDILAMKSSFGEMIPGIEVQAHILSSLMKSSYCQTVSKPVVILIYLVGGVIIGRFMTAYKIRQRIKHLGLGIFGGS